MEVDDRFVELNPRTCVVLGGRGFLGRSLVLRLLKLGKWNVRIADSSHSLHLDPSEHDSLLSIALSSGRASYFHVDVRDKLQIVRAINGSSVVFYMDYDDSCAKDYYLSYMVIVQGAKNVINACRDCKVRRLVFNSSADVIFNGSRDIHNGDESLTYPMKFIIGNGGNLSDFTYVENVTHAHICAEEALDFRMVSVAGKAFFITNFEPMKYWEFTSLILEGLGYQRPTIKLPFKMVWNILLFLKWIHEKFGFNRYNHFIWSHYVHLASCTRTFNCVAARKELGYSPVVSLKQPLVQTSFTIRLELGSSKGCSGSFDYGLFWFKDCKKEENFS